MDVQLLIINEVAEETYSSRAIDCTTFPLQTVVLTEGIFQLSTIFSHVDTASGSAWELSGVSPHSHVAGPIKGVHSH